jgi:hypothetical protein
VKIHNSTLKARLRQPLDSSRKNKTEKQARQNHGMARVLPLAASHNLLAMSQKRQQAKYYSRFSGEKPMLKQRTKNRKLTSSYCFKRTFIQYTSICTATGKITFNTND